MRSLTPVEVSNLTDVRQFAAGTFYSLALKDDGTVWAWGNNVSGHLGNETNTLGTNTPAQVSELGGLRP
jgi:alpha-tubulin suppressor-like RCC1 family protein